MLGALVLAGLATSMVLPDFIAKVSSVPDDAPQPDGEDGAAESAGDFLEQVMLASWDEADDPEGEEVTGEPQAAAPAQGVAEQEQALSEGLAERPFDEPEPEGPESPLKVPESGENAEDSGGAAETDEDPENTEDDPNPWREPLEVEVEAGTHVVENFSPDEDRLIVTLPDSASELALGEATEGRFAVLGWQQEDGAVELVFDTLDTVPVEAIEVQFSGLDYTVALSEVLDVQNGGGAEITDPEEASVAPVPEDDDASGATVTDPEAPSEPDADGFDPEGAVLSPVNDPDAWDNDPDPVFDSDVGEDRSDPEDSSDVPEDDTKAVQRIDGFTPGEDILQIQTDATGALSIIPDPDDPGMVEVFVGETLVAILTDAEGLGEDDVVIDRLPSVRAA